MKATQRLNEIAERHGLPLMSDDMPVNKYVDAALTIMMAELGLLRERSEASDRERSETNEQSASQTRS
jgi:hypothetical protein